MFMYFTGESGCLSLTTTTSAVAAAAAAASSSLPTGTPPTVLALADTTADGIALNLISIFILGPTPVAHSVLFILSRAIRFDFFSQFCSFFISLYHYLSSCICNRFSLISWHP